MESGCHDVNVPDWMQAACEGMWPFQDETGKDGFVLSDLHAGLMAPCSVSLGSPPKPVCFVDIFSSPPLSLEVPCLHGDIFTVSHEGIDGHWWTA